MASLVCLLLAFFSSISFTVGVPFNEETILGDDATGYGPIFEEDPVDVVYTEGSPDGRISMSCRARASPPASYSWWQNNTRIELMKLPDEHYSLVGGNLVINNPEQGKHAGTYFCLAKNIYGTVVSKAAHVKFGYLEEFPQEEKEPVYVTEGQGAVLLCDPPKAYPQEVTYRWIYNEFPVFLHTDNRRFVSQKTGNLYIAKVEAQDAGNYSCFVSNPIIGKSVFSKFIPLIPLLPKHGEERRYPPDIRVKFPTTTAVLASNITLECFAFGNPIPLIMWRKVDATDLPPNHEISESGAVLHLYNVQHNDVGAYDCEAINTEGKNNHKTRLYVESAPEWVETINNTQKELGSRHTMRCVAAGQPSPSIRWYKDGVMFGKGELTFFSLALDDSGMYQCIAENYWGVKYATAELRVFAYAPSFEFNPVKKQLLGAKGGRVLIECKPRAAPKPHISWTKGKELLFSNSRISVLLDGTLEILNATKNDEGFYTCIAVNYRGKGSSTGYLTITDKPGPPGEIRIDEIGDTWVKLEWTKGAEHNSPITHYTVQTRFFWALHEGDWRNASTSPTVIDGSLEKADVTGLFPWMDYQFRITAHNEYGAGEASIPSLKIKTLDAYPVVYPSDLSAYRGTNREIVITWTPVQPWHFYGKNFGYVVAMKPYSAYDWWYDVIRDPEANRHVHRVSIPTDEDFLVKIKCFNVKGEGPYSTTMILFADEAAHASNVSVSL